MSDPDFIGTAAAIYIGVLSCGVVLFITFIPLLDRWVDKIKEKRAAKQADSEAPAPVSR